MLAKCLLICYIEMAFAFATETIIELRNENPLKHSESIVFVTQIPHRRVGENWVPEKNISAASDFGSLRIMVPHGPSILETEALVKLLMKELSEYDYDRGDVVLMIGDPSIIAVAGACITEFSSKFRILKWERTIGKYFSVDIQIPEGG